MMFENGKLFVTFNNMKIHETEYVYLCEKVGEITLRAGGGEGLRMWI